MNKEWQEASNERAIEQKMNPIHGMYRSATLPAPTLTAAVSRDPMFRNHLRGVLWQGICHDEVVPVLFQQITVVCFFSVPLMGSMWPYTSTGIQHAQD